MVTALLLAAGSLTLAPTLSSAAPTKAEIQTAKAQLASLYRDLDLLVEQYNQANAQLQQIKAELAEIRDIQTTAEADARSAIASLEGRVSTAYMDRGSQLDVLLGAGSFSEFSDRLEFLSQLQEDDAALAARAEAAGQRAEWAATELSNAQKAQDALLKRLSDKKSQISSSIDEQKELVSELGDEYQQALARRQAAQEAAARAESATEDEPAATSTGSSPTTAADGGSPPPTSGGAQAAIAAAYSVLGTRYVWGGASPSGFDCSGLTMWAWQHGGVSLPHNSQAQYAATARVDRSDLQPGDLIFFYSPISHVSLYIGGGRMIDASHPGPGGEVQVAGVWWDAYVGAGRP